MKTLPPFASAATLAAVIGLLTACGAKGPLFLPEKPVEAAPAEEAVPAPAEDAVPGEDAPDAPDAPVQPEDESPQEQPATPTDGNG